MKGQIMKNKFYAILLALFILFCGFLEETNLIQQQTSIAKAVALIKKYINDDSQEVTKVTVVNSHDGKYTVTSSIWTGLDSVRLSTHVVDMAGRKRDTSINVTKKDFLVKLDKASHPFTSIKMAGHYQRISVKRNGREETFETVGGRTLMNLLQYGE